MRLGTYSLVSCWPGQRFIGTQKPVQGGHGVVRGAHGGGTHNPARELS